MRRAFAAGIGSAALHAMIVLGLVAPGPSPEPPARAAPIEITIVQPPTVPQTVPPAAVAPALSPRTSRGLPPGRKRVPHPTAPPVAPEPPIDEPPPAPADVPVTPEAPPAAPPPSAIAPEVEASDGPAPATGRSALEGREAARGYAASQLGAIREAIQRHLVYPPRARRMGWTGRVTVRFRVGAGGAVSEVSVVASSRIPALDDSAVESVRRAAPFTPPPWPVEIVVPVTFDLEE